MLLRSIILGIANARFVEKFVRHSRLTRKVVKRFVAGDTLDDAMAVAEQLVAEGYHVTLDLLGEHTSADAEADAAANEYLNLLRAIAKSSSSGGSAPERINISIKLTQLGLLNDEEACLKRLRLLVSEAAMAGNFVRIDMEDSGCTERTLACAVETHAEIPSVGIVLQSMLRRTERDVEMAIDKKIRTRLVKGAYAEPENVAYQKKREVERSFRDSAARLLADGYYPAFGTHDHRIIADLRLYAKAHDIQASRFEFQLLFGIRRDLQAELRKAGYNVRVYVPYGKSWYPYFTRRLAERPANLLFFLRALFSR